MRARPGIVCHRLLRVGLAIQDGVRACRRWRFGYFVDGTIRKTFKTQPLALTSPSLGSFSDCACRVQCSGRGRPLNVAVAVTCEHGPRLYFALHCNFLPERVWFRCCCGQLTLSIHNITLHLDGFSTCVQLLSSGQCSRREQGTAACLIYLKLSQTT
jgi:hypothetical protein